MRDMEIKLIYNANKQKDKEVMGYAQSLDDHKLNETDVSKTKLTERQIATMASDLGIAINDLIDKNEEKYFSEVKGGSFSDEELLKLMVNNPELIHTPIAYVDGKAKIVKSQYSLVSKDMDAGGVKSDQGNQFEK